jgi:hypothetical protein
VFKLAIWFVNTWLSHTLNCFLNSELCIRFRIPSPFYLLVLSKCRGFSFSLDHTQTHTTVGKTPLDEGSARRRDHYLTTQTLHKTNIHAPGGIRTHHPSNRTAADLRLRPRSHWDRRLASCTGKWLILVFKLAVGFVNT